MAVKNKDVLILIKKIEKYFKEECYISFEHESGAFSHALAVS